MGNNYQEKEADKFLKNNNSPLNKKQEKLTLSYHGNTLPIETRAHTCTPLLNYDVHFL
jgi:hypothetical protein